MSEDNDHENEVEDEECNDIYDPEYGEEEFRDESDFEEEDFNDATDFEDGAEIDEEKESESEIECVNIDDLEAIELIGAEPQMVKMSDEDRKKLGPLAQCLDESIENYNEGVKDCYNREKFDNILYPVVQLMKFNIKEYKDKLMKKRQFIDKQVADYYERNKCEEWCTQQVLDREKEQYEEKAIRDENMKLALEGVGLTWDDLGLVDRMYRDLIPNYFIPGREEFVNDLESEWKNMNWKKRIGFVKYLESEGKFDEAKFIMDRFGIPDEFIH